MEWQYSTIHDCACKVIKTQTLWGERICRVWLPGSDSVVRIPAANLKPVENAGTGTADGIAYVAVAARVADALTEDMLLVPIASSVIPLTKSVPCPEPSQVTVCIVIRVEGGAHE